jgi:hypothetical protein
MARRGGTVSVSRMETPADSSGLATLGEDLLPLVVKRDGTIEPAPLIEYGLMGSELIRLTAAGRVEIADDYIVLSSDEPTGIRSWMPRCSASRWPGSGRCRRGTGCPRPGRRSAWST